MQASEGGRWEGHLEGHREGVGVDLAPLLAVVGLLEVVVAAGGGLRCRQTWVR